MIVMRQMMHNALKSEWQWLFVLLLILTCAPDMAAQRQFPHLFELDSRNADTLSTPDATSSRHRYRVTAWGTYSMWEDTVNSSVDPVWIYSFPDEEWAKPEWRLFPEGYPIYVGDSRMFDSHGLRVNNTPFPELPLNETDHRYSMIIQGDGNPVTTSLVDWNFKGLTKRDAHDNNSGYLYVLVEELPLTEMEICTVDSSQFPVVRVSLKVLRDSVLYEDLFANLQITENGVPVQIDSVDCSERVRPVSVAMVFDRSGSMREAWGASTRMEEVKIAGNRFVARLSDEDEGAIYSFSDDVQLDQAWTTDKAALHDAINLLSPGGYTAMNDAIADAITGVADRSDVYKKAVVVLSDGEDNISTIKSIAEVIQKARAEAVPVYAIGLLLENDDSLRLLAQETGGKYFSVKDAAAIDSVFEGIAEQLFEKGCCNVWYRSPETRKDGTWRGVEADVAFPGDTTVSVSDGYRAPFSTSAVEERDAYQGITLALSPNPAVDVTTLQIIGAKNCELQILITNALGQSMYSPEKVVHRGGKSTVEISVSNLPAGRYFLRAESDGVLYHRSFDVVR